MADEAYWADLRPVLQDMADRIARIEQFLASSGLQAPASGSSFAAAGGAGDFFDSAPASFGPASFGPASSGPASASNSPLSGPQPGALPDDILLLARSGKKIQAISEFHKRTGMSLKEAKAIIDQAAHGY